MNAAHLLAYVGISDDYTQAFFKSFAWEHRIFTEWEYNTLGKKYPDFKAADKPRFFPRACCFESAEVEGEISITQRQQRAKEARASSLGGLADSLSLNPLKTSKLVGVQAKNIGQGCANKRANPPACLYLDGA